MIDTIKGVDVSMVHELEKLGAVYRDENGAASDIFKVLRDYGVGAVRLRYWNDPYDEWGEPYGGGTNDFTATAAMARRIIDAGMEFWLNIHYSDFWTDPGKQTKPKEWVNFTGLALRGAVYTYTRTLLERLAAEKIVPVAVQIGNEITDGLLWDDGKFEGGGDEMFRLISSGIDAVRDFNREIKIMLHLDFGGDNARYRRFFDRAAELRLDYDIIGMSYYPYWHGTLDELSANMEDCAKRYGKDIVIAETAYGYTSEVLPGCNSIFNDELAEKGGFAASEDGQACFMVALMERIKAVRGGMGFIYWCPEWIPIAGSTWATEVGRAYIGDTSEGGNSWANQSLFRADGSPLPALDRIKEF